MFQVKVPSWGSKPTQPSFEIVSSPSSSAKPPNKRPHTASKSGDEDSLPSGQPSKKSKVKEDNSSQKHAFQPSSKPIVPSTTAITTKTAQKSAPVNPSPSKAVQPPKSKNSSEKPRKQTGNPETSVKLQPSGKELQKHGSKKSSFGSPAAKSTSHPVKSSTSSKDTKRSPKSAHAKKQKKKGSDDEEDSIDELFGSYGGSDSDFSITSDESGDGGIVIRSPDDSDASDSESGPATKKADELSSEGFSDSDSEDGRMRGSSKLSAMQEQMKAKLEGGRFRFINQKLYTTTGKDAFSLFQAEPALFDVYHQGYRNQVDKWPENPLDIIINYLKKQSKALVVADFGCGEARLAQSVPQKNVHSFDLVARNKYITACDIAHVPLKDASVDVAVFCLSLMGTNVEDFLLEANRVLKVGGVLKIAEVKSRFEKISTFAEALTKAGFDVKNKDESNKMFVLFECVKTVRKPVKDATVTLKPCIYKRR